jgi:SAM-dependent MidA family methyltransferase
MTAPASDHPKPTRTPLEGRLLSLIADNGPISVGDFMADALAHPQHGYYSTEEPFGTHGDFVTAPEVSQIFGELVGAWLVDSWEAIGAPSLFQLVEFGPGRGTLMSDILRVGAIRPAFLEAARITMIESSGRLRVRQRQTLDNRHSHIVWRDSPDDIPPGPMLAVANEFFDCLPIRQFVYTAAGKWRERLVGCDGDGETARLCFVLSKEEYDERPGAPTRPAPEDIYEECEAGRQLVETLAERLTAHKGRLLILDYGHGRTGVGDTFQAVKRHDYVHPLHMPGQVDVTAHVDFAALARTARQAGIRVDGPVRQGDFLRRLGLEQRLEALKAAAADDTVRQSLERGAQRIAASDQMGDLFKAMAISSPTLPEPPGFS